MSAAVRTWLMLLPFVAVAGLFLHAEWSAIREFTFTLDDVWIHLEMARNFATGGGFAFNPGHPISASTAPLYTALLAALFLVSDDVLLNVYAIGIGATLASLYFGYLMVRHLTGEESTALLVAALVATNPWIAWSALSGMEISLGAALLSAGAFAFLRSREGIRWRVGATMAFFLLPLVRPECYALLVPYVALDLVSAWQSAERGKALREVFFRACLGVSLLLPNALFCRSVTGSWLPNTYAAKVGDFGWTALFDVSGGVVAEAWFRRVGEYAAFFAGVLRYTAPAVALLFAPSGILLALTAARTRDASRLFLPLSLIVFVLAVGTAVPVDLVSFPWPRHMLHFLPLLLAWTLAAPFLLLPNDRRARGVVAAALVALVAWTLPAGHALARDFFVDRTRSIRSEHLALADWVRHNVSSEAVIAASDIGIVGYYTENFILDTEGIINPDVIRFRERRNSPEKDREVLAFLKTTRPDYLFKFVWAYPTLSPSDFPLQERFGTIALYRTPWTRAGLDRGARRPAHLRASPPIGRVHARQ